MCLKLKLAMYSIKTTFNFVEIFIKTTTDLLSKKS